jgi:hypothetical protein
LSCCVVTYGRHGYVSTPRQEVVVGGATLALFSSSKELKTGKQKLRLWHARQADGSVPTTTPGKVFFSTNYSLVIVVIVFIVMVCNN